MWGLVSASGWLAAARIATTALLPPASGLVGGPRPVDRVIGQWAVRYRKQTLRPWTPQSPPGNCLPPECAPWATGIPTLLRPPAARCCRAVQAGQTRGGTVSGTSTAPPPISHHVVRMDGDHDRGMAWHLNLLVAQGIQAGLCLLAPSEVLSAASRCSSRSRSSS